MFKRSGFTLIELMIAIAIGAIIISGIYGVFTQQTQQLIYQDMQMEMHQNLRLATDVLTRTGRMAGYGTGGQAWGLLGYYAGSGDANEAMPSIISYNGTGPNQSDAITFLSMDPALSMATTGNTAPDCSTGQLQVDPSIMNNSAKVAQLNNGDMLLCVDYAPITGYKSYLWKIDSATVVGSEAYINISGADGKTDYGNNCGSNLPLIMICSRAEVTTFYIDNDDTDGIGAGSADHPVLMMDMDFESPDDDDVPVVDNIEDMQFQYCLRSSAGVTDCATDTWKDTIDDYSNSDDQDDPDDLYMIRIGLIARSSREDPRHLYQTSRPGLFGNADSTTIDGYYRQPLVTEITVRNMRLLHL